MNEKNHSQVCTQKLPKCTLIISDIYDFKNEVSGGKRDLSAEVTVGFRMALRGKIEMATQRRERLKKAGYYSTGCSECTGFCYLIQQTVRYCHRRDWT